MGTTANARNELQSTPVKVPSSSEEEEEEQVGFPPIIESPLEQAALQVRKEEFEKAAAYHHSTAGLADFQGGWMADSLLVFERS
jgi:hypothetical protein